MSYADNGFTAVLELEYIDQIAHELGAELYTEQARRRRGYRHELTELTHARMIGHDFGRVLRKAMELASAIDPSDIAMCKQIGGIIQRGVQSGAALEAQQRRARALQAAREVEKTRKLLREVSK
jgi:hypothetical protein